MSSAVQSTVVYGRPLAPRPAFTDVARIIAGSDAPPWLAPHLEWTAQGLRHDRAFDAARPTKVQMRQRLESAREAASVLLHALNSPYDRPLLEHEDLRPIPSDLRYRLEDLARRAEYAIALPTLSNDDGSTARGRNKATMPGSLSAKTLCAARIVETWIYFHQFCPGPRNKKAAAAADAFWRASGAPRKSFGSDPVGSWRHLSCCRFDGRLVKLIPPCVRTQQG
jgi:hypothetical protein